VKKQFNRILSISLLVGLLFTQVAVHFLHNHEDPKPNTEQSVLSASDSLCLACSMEFTTALFYASFATFLFIIGSEIFHATPAIRPSRSFSIFQIGRAPPLTA